MSHQRKIKRVQRAHEIVGVGKSDRPCFLLVFTQMKRKEKTLPASTDRFCLRTSVRSDDCSNMCHRRQNKAACW